MNEVVEKYLIPGTQVGVKIAVDDAGDVGLIHTVARRLMPGAGCMWCNGLIDPTELAIDMAPSAQRRAARYVDEVPAPSVITLNSVAVAEAANDFMMAVTNLHLPDPATSRSLPDAESSEAEYASTYPRHRRAQRTVPRRDPNCPWCGTHPATP